MVLLNIPTLDNYPPEGLENKHIYFSSNSDCLEVSTSNSMFKEIGNADMDGFWEPGENATIELNLANFCDDEIENPGVDLTWDDDILACGTDTCHPPVSTDPGGNSDGGGSNGGDSGGTYGSSETGARSSENQFNDTAEFEKILANRMIRVHWNMHIDENAESDVFITLDAKVTIQNCENDETINCPDSEISFDIFIGVPDADEDGIKDDEDLCLNTLKGQFVNLQGCPDSDNDGVFDNFDICPNGNDLIDSDNDEIPDACDDFIDSDNDGIIDSEDLCLFGPDWIDIDKDNVIDGCDDLIDSDNDGVADTDDLCEGHDDNLDLDLDSKPDGCDLFVDSDFDSVRDSEDICPNGNDLIDFDRDGIPDDCDDFIDFDNDGVIDSEDNCKGYDDKIDLDNDGIPDGCDSNIDFDRDGVPDSLDTCPNDFATIDLNRDGCQDLDLCLEISCDNLQQSVDLEAKDGLMTSLTIKVAAISITTPTLIMVGYVCSSETIRFPFNKRWWAFTALLFGMKRESGEFQRGRILGFLSGNQGAHVALIKNILKLSNGQMSHHLTVLEKEGLVWSIGDGRKLRYYTHHIEIDDYKSLPKPPLHVVFGSTQYTILKRIEEEKGENTTLSELSNALKRTPSLVNYHLSNLYQNNFIIYKFKKFSKVWGITPDGETALINAELNKKDKVEDN